MIFRKKIEKFPKILYKNTPKFGIFPIFSGHWKQYDNLLFSSSVIVAMKVTSKI